MFFGGFREDSKRFDLVKCSYRAQAQWRTQACSEPIGAPKISQKPICGSSTFHSCRRCPCFMFDQQLTATLNIIISLFNIHKNIDCFSPTTFGGWSSTGIDLFLDANCWDDELHTLTMQAGALGVIFVHHEHGSEALGMKMNFGGISPGRNETL